MCFMFQRQNSDVVCDQAAMFYSCVDVGGASFSRSPPGCLLKPRFSFFLFEERLMFTDIFFNMQQQQQSSSSADK